MRKKSKLTYGVIGLGRFGMALAVTLAESDNDVIVMDREESSIREMRNYTDYAFVTNDLSMEALREAGIHNCDVVIVCIGEKVDVSVLTTMSVIEIGVPRVIAKALSPEQGAVLKKLGAEVVYPERDMALRLGRRLLSGNFLDYIPLDHSVQITQIRIPERMVGKTVEQIQLRRKYGLNIIAIESGSETTIEVQPDYQLKDGDIIVVIGKADNINTFEVWDKDRIKMRILDPADIDGPALEAIPKTPYTKWFDYDIIENSVTIRTRRPGDYLVIGRDGATQKLNRYFINEKIPSRERDRILLAADGSRIMWVIGYRRGQGYEVTGQTKKILEITIDKGGKYDGRDN